MQLVRIEEKSRSGCTRQARFRFLVARDILTVFMILQLTIVVLGAIVYACDTDRSLNERYNSLFETRQRSWKVLHGYSRVYYGCGLLLLFLLIGLYTTAAYCCGNCGGGRSRSTTRSGDCCDACCTSGNDNAFWCWYYCDSVNTSNSPGPSADCCECCGSCDCPGGGGGGGGDCGEAGAAIAGVLLVIAAILAILLIFVGLITALLSCLYMVQRVIQRHVHIVNKHLLAREYIVLDLGLEENHGLLTQPSYAPGADAMERGEALRANSNGMDVFGDQPLNPALTPSAPVAPPHYKPHNFSAVSVQLSKDLQNI